MADVKSTFRQASEDWLQSRSSQISARSKREYKLYVGVLNRTFGNMPLSAIEDHHIRTYQRERRKKASPVCINHECNVLAEILKAHGLWDAIKSHYKRMQAARGRRSPAFWHSALESGISAAQAENSSVTPSSVRYHKTQIP